MQVGDWVEFQTVVVKRRHAGGSVPATQAFTHTRCGMVIGERHVYDATADTPPTLSNPRRVLLVAVSLHRSYRVYPSDVRPTSPPRRRQRRVLPPPAPVVQATGAPTDGGSAQTVAGGV
jgi:hypothetical protein